MIRFCAFFSLIGLISCSGQLQYNPDRNFTDIQKETLTQFILADDSTVIELPEGHFLFSKSLILEGKKNITIIGQGIDKTILSFKGQTEGAEGIRIANCANIAIRDMTVEDAAGDNVKITDTKGITIDNVKTGWTGVVDEQNGAYGFYPVLCENVVIRNSDVYGASDAGIYVGQSDTVLIENNRTYWNVAGIESENSTEVIIRNNESYENTGGILVFDLPGLTQYGRNIEVHNNSVYENNTPNFAPPGNMVGVTPAGTGILILATTGVQVHDNEIRNNKTIGVGMVSYALLEAMGFDEGKGSGTRASLEQSHNQDKNYNPFVGDVSVFNNQISNDYTLPDFDSDFGKLFLWKFGFDRPAVAWDGLQSPDYFLADGSINPNYRICVKEAVEILTVNLDAANEFEGLEVNPEIFNCD